MTRKHIDNYKLKDDWLLLPRVSDLYVELFSRGHLQGVQQLSQSFSSPARDHFQDLSCSTYSILAIVSKGASSTDVSSAATAHLCIQVSCCLINKSMTPERGAEINILKKQQHLSILALVSDALSWMRSNNWVERNHISQKTEYQSQCECAPCLIFSCNVITLS